MVALADAFKPGLSSWNASKSPTFTDVWTILMGRKDAAMQYLRRTTTGQLSTAFQPIMPQSLEKVGATCYYTTPSSTYNRIPLVKSVQTDFNQYATGKAIDGLFTRIAQEEADIRENPVPCATALLAEGGWRLSGGALDAVSGRIGRASVQPIMRYVSLDLETSGPNPARHQVLELAAAIEDSRHPLPLAELPAFRRVVRHPEYVGTAGAIALNARLFEELAQKEPNPELCTPAELLPQLREFLLDQGFKPDKKDCVAVTMAGKNIAVFDLGFLRELPGYGTLVRAEPAMLDPAAFYLNWHKDSRLPTMSICKARAGLGPDVAHEALADALDVVRLLRPFYVLPLYKQVSSEGTEAG